ncbi:hypothetical protein NLD30_00490 [SCandidatus Aminicenantes bacterium Aminicenantia_JdfR_composite]|jgi:hypothetical protein|nr:hypothetical protein [SCandidatus Aminicenantes bacterium Aminicenantia_JdfR_composite]MCP2596828.1 hypothetical protein [Candidatus Aminicenantes bacterium AC-335-G13]MCP2620921.1 hypothetical protein [Candidatus Aminicenantes bacterium AC-334-E05]
MNKTPELCIHGIKKQIPDKQIGHEGRFLSYWVCGHRDPRIRRRYGRVKPSCYNCPEFKEVKRDNKEF